jgi:hypothetical protein
MGGAMPSIYRSASLLSTLYIAKKFTADDCCDDGVDTKITGGQDLEKLYKEDEKLYKDKLHDHKLEPREKLNPMYYCYESEPIYTFNAVNADGKNVSLA